MFLQTRLPDAVVMERERPRAVWAGIANPGASDMDATQTMGWITKHEFL